MKKHIPNIITLCNLFCGVMAAWQAAKGHLTWAAGFMIIGILFDFFDGLAARLLKVSSTLGKELDSMADLITSGVAPGFILFYILLGYDGWWGIKFVGFLVPVFAACRLAKFNLDERQSCSFLGLPAPANALLLATVGVCCMHPEWLQYALLPIPKFAMALYSQTGMLVLAIFELALCLLMISEKPMFGLKVKNLRWNDNQIRYIFLIGCVILIFVFGIPALAFCIIWYILLSLLTQRKEC